MATLANLIGYQAVWLVTAFAARAGLAWPGPVAAAVFVGTTLVASRTRRTDAVVMLAAVACGVLLDGGLAAGGVLGYAAADPALPPGGAPLWILALWSAFALTLTRSLRWLVSSPARAGFTGLIGGPLAYSAAARLGAVEFRGTAYAATFLIAIGWGVALVGLAALSRHRARHGGTRVVEVIR